MTKGVEIEEMAPLRRKDSKIGRELVIKYRLLANAVFNQNATTKRMYALKLHTSEISKFLKELEEFGLLEHKVLTISDRATKVFTATKKGQKFVALYTEIMKLGLKPNMFIEMLQLNPKGERAW